MQRENGVSRLLVRGAAVVVLCCCIAVGPLGGAASADAQAQGRTSDNHGVDRAWAWVRTMLATSTRIESNSTLYPARSYPAEWTGPVSGTFVLDGVQPPPVIPAAVTLDQQSSINAGSAQFHGVITGRVTLPPESGRWIIQAYRERAHQLVQVPLQSLVQPDGTFTMDLSGAPGGTDNWQFGVLDAAAHYAPIGLPWPSAGIYTGWEIRSFATTDRRYLIGTQPASADGRFSFASSAPGTKSFQLVAVSTPTGRPPIETVLAEYAPVTGLVRSFAAAAGDPAAVSDNSYAYDQALALQSSLVVDDLPTARALAEGLLTLQTRSGPQAGGFISTAAQGNPAAGEPIYRTGNTAIALYALLSYLRRIEQSDPAASAIRSAAELAVDWLLAQQLNSGPMSGLLTGGWGQLGPSGAEPNVRMPFASTEHNLDAWHALSRAGRTLNCARCTDAADSLRTAILGTLWDPSRAAFTQGMRPEGRDTVDPLDVNSWGSIFLAGVGQPAEAAASLNRTSAFSVADGGVQGYLAFRAQQAIPNPVPTVWFEGSFGVALGHARNGDTAGSDAVLAGLIAAQRLNGSFPMASSPDAAREFSTASSMAATTWFILASRPQHPDSLWAAEN